MSLPQIHERSLELNFSDSSSSSNDSSNRSSSRSSSFQNSKKMDLRKFSFDSTTDSSNSNGMAEKFGPTNIERNVENPISPKIKENSGSIEAATFTKFQRSSALSFYPGDPVNINWNGGNRRGTVLMRNRNGTFQVELLEGNVVKAISAAALEKANTETFKINTEKMNEINGNFYKSDLEESPPLKNKLSERAYDDGGEDSSKESLTDEESNNGAATPNILPQLPERVKSLTSVVSEPFRKYEGGSRKRSVSFGPIRTENNHLRHVLRKSFDLADRHPRAINIEDSPIYSSSPISERSKALIPRLSFPQRSQQGIFSKIKQSIQRTGSEALKSLLSSPKSLRGTNKYFSTPSKQLLQEKIYSDDNLKDLDEPNFQSPLKDIVVDAASLNQDAVSCGPMNSFSKSIDQYIENRIDLQRQTSAAGPKSLPKRIYSNNLFEQKPLSTVVLSNKINGRSLEASQSIPFTEALFMSGVSETPLSKKLGIILEGWLKKFSPDSVRGYQWHSRYFVLYAATCELRYYRNCQDAAWGRVPIEERGSIPLRLLVRIEQPSKANRSGCHFDLVVRHKGGGGRYPGIQVRPGNESTVDTTKVYKFCTEDPEDCLLWCTVLSSFMKSIEQTRKQTERYGAPHPARYDVNTLPPTISTGINIVEDNQS